MNYLYVGVSHSVMSDSVTLWTIACQASLSIEFSRQEYWSGLPFPFLGDLPNPGIEPAFLALQADSFPSVPPEKPPVCICWRLIPCQLHHLRKYFK